MRPAARAQITTHWRQRVLERIGPDVCPYLLADELLRAIAQGDQRRVEFLGRLRRDGIRAFRFALLGGRVFVALVETDRWVAITVLGEGHSLRLHRGEVVPCGAQGLARQRLAPLVGQGAQHGPLR